MLYRVPLMTRDELRILDASLNRAAEALRVAEDVCRFAFELPVLARTLKEARHTLLAAFAPGLSQRAVLAGSRDSDGDVGRSHAVAPPNGLTVADVAVRNLERAREALRTLEEISADILAIEKEAEGLLDGLLKVGGKA